MTIKDLYQSVNDGTIISDIELQREIVYDTEKQRLVIDSLVNGIPLPAFYFWKREDGKLEVLDGKQRIEAIKNFIHNYLKYDNKLWCETDKEIQDRIEAIEIKDIICSGDEKLKREIFRRINTLGVPLSEYEVLNGLFNGEYLRGLSAYCEQDNKAKKVLGKTSRGVAKINCLRLLGVLKNFSGRDGVYNYVSANKDNSFAADQRLIKRYINFVADVFDDYGQLGIYFNLAIKYIGDITIWKENKREINRRIKSFLKSDEAKLIENKAKEIEDIIQTIVNGISVDPKRLFNTDDKAEFLEQQEQQNGLYQCADCKQWFAPNELQMDHIKAWSKGGRTVLSNAALRCGPCNRKKSNL